MDVISSFLFIKYLDGSLGLPTVDSVHHPYIAVHIELAYLAGSAEQVFVQNKESCFCKSNSPFTPYHYNSLQDYIIDITLIVTFDVPFITSFQSPLTIQWVGC